MSVLARAPDASRESEPVLVLAPMSVEARAVRAGAPWAQVERIGMGPRRAARSAAAANQLPPTRAVLLAGFCGALDETLEPGDIVLASELRDPAGDTVQTADPTILAGVLRRGGLRVHVGPIASSDRLVRGERRRELSRTGALAVDMESVWLAPAIHDRPFLALRVVLDTASRELHRPLQTLTGFTTAYRSLRRACELAEEWSGALGDREVMLASPRASCAGVDRAVEIVEAALRERGAPVYVRKQIVHNRHVVGRLESLGAVFVEELDEVPDGATVVFSAHGVSPAVRAQRRRRGLRRDRRHLPAGDQGARRGAALRAGRLRHRARRSRGPRGGRGHARRGPRAHSVIAARTRSPTWRWRTRTRVAYLTQTTLAVDETAGVVDALRTRFPDAVGPPSSDICYATQNRQDAVRALAADCDLVLVVGSENSSNSRRLVEVAIAPGAPPCSSRVPSRSRRRRSAGVRRVGLTAGASAPEALVQRVVRALAGLGAVTRERTPCGHREHALQAAA